MTTQTLEKKVEQLENRVVVLERQIVVPTGYLPTNIGKDGAYGLRLLQGLWRERPRTTKDLRRVRRLIWGD